MAASDQNHPPSDPPGHADGQGRAALLLVESLIHSLIARSTLTTTEAIEIVEIASEVDQGIAYEIGEGRAGSLSAALLLDAIAESLRRDIM